MLVAIKEFYNSSINRLNLLDEPLLFVDFSRRFVEEFGRELVDELKASLPSPSVVVDSVKLLRHYRTHPMEEQIKQFFNRIGAVIAEKPDAPPEEMEPVPFKGTPTWAIAALFGCSFAGIALAFLGNCLNKSLPETNGSSRTTHPLRHPKRRWKAGFLGGLWTG